MDATKGSETAFRKAGKKPRIRALHWPLMGLALALALVFTTSSASAGGGERCEDFTDNNRPCTATEEYGYCLSNAMDSYEDCLEDAGFWGKVGCTIAYDVDFWACALMLPVELLKGAN
jgi:hypothetical protein